jgi:hypothetical protein
MAMKALLDSIEDLDDNIASEYTKKKVGDKEVYVLDVTDFSMHPEATALKVALERQKADNKTLKTEKATLEAKLKDFPEEFTVDEWQRLLALDVDDETEDGKKKKKEIEDARLAAARKQFETTIANLKKEKEELQGKYDTDIGKERTGRAGDRADTQLSESLTKAGVRPGLLNAAKRMLKDNVKHEVEEDGTLRVFVSTDLGEQEIASYVENWAKSDEGKEFVAPASGGGAEGGGKSQSTTVSGDNPFTPGAWNKTAQGALFKTDRNKAERLAKTAGFPNLDVALGARSAIASK